MVKVKNVRPGIVIIADARLKLGAGEVAEISSLTPQTKKAVDDGLLARVDIDPESRTKMKAPVKIHEQTKPNELVLNDGKQPEVKNREEPKTVISETGTKNEPG